MVRIAVSSDNHLDVNQVDVNAALQMQAEWLCKQKVDYYFYAGDLFNRFTSTRHYFDQLRTRLQGKVQVYYIAGNHDLLNAAPFSLVESRFAPAYLHNAFVDLPGTDWRVIGNNGWYDYSFSAYADRPAEVGRWKKVYWLDSAVDQPMSDNQRMRLVLRQVKAQLAAARAARKRVALVTHFAPRRELLSPQPDQVKTPRQQRFYQMINAMLGSQQLGELLEAAGNVRLVFYGHLHGSHPPYFHGGVQYLNQAVGVKNKRINEWQAQDFTTQWQRTLRIADLQ